MNQAEHTGTECLRLQRSAADEKLFDLVEPVFDRYTRVTTKRQSNEVFKFDRQVPVVAASTRLRYTSKLAVAPPRFWLESLMIGP